MYKEQGANTVAQVAKLYHETVGKGISQIRERTSKLRLAGLEPGEYYTKAIPMYISQLAGAKRGKIDGFYGKILDDNASKRFGATSLEDFSYWAWRSCGIVCVQMILGTMKESNFSGKTKDLINEGLRLNGYDIATDRGWYHASLAKLAESHDLSAKVRKFVPSSEIAEDVVNGKYVLASVKSGKGHLLLIFGVKLSDNGGVEGFRLHNPNDYSGPGESIFMPRKEFDKLSTRRVIVITR